MKNLMKSPGNKRTNQLPSNLTEEKAKIVPRHFNSIASKYDLMNSLLSFGFHHYWKRKALRKLGLKTGDSIIDVCGGTADLSMLAAATIGPQGRVILYDINQAMMEAGKTKVIRASFAGRIRFIQGDAEQMALANGVFDAAMVGFGIRNLSKMEKGLEEMYRVLKPGGKLMCLEFSRPTASIFRWLYDFYSFHLMPRAGKILAGSREAYTYLSESIREFPLPEELAAILGKIGFSMVAYHRLTNGIAVVHTGVKPKSSSRQRRGEGKRGARGNFG